MGINMGLKENINSRDEIVSDEEIEILFRGTNFGSTDYREILREALAQLCAGFSTGHTAHTRLQLLGLIGGKSPALTKKGRKYLYYANNVKILEVSK